VKRKVLGIGGVAISVVCLAWAFRGLHYREILEVLRSVEYGWTPLILGATLVSIWLRAWRWQIMLEPIRKVSLAQAYSSTMIGFMANNVLPLRFGEVVRAYSLGRASGVSKSAAFATIVVERAFDLVALLLILALLLLRYSFDPWFQTLGVIALAACVVMFAGMALIRWKKALALRMVGAVSRRLPPGLQSRVDTLVSRFLSGFDVLTRGHHIFMVTLLSILVWVATAGSFYFTLLTFRLDLPLPASFVLMVVCALGVMLPSGPGFVGTFEVAAKYGLLLFQVPEEIAVSYAIYYHAVQFIPLTLLGMYHLWRENFSLTRAVEGKDDEVGEDDEGS